MLATQQRVPYKRHRPETMLLYQMVERYYPEFTANLAEQGKYLPKYVEREFEEFLRCGRLEQGFLLVVCGGCKHEKLVAFSCKRRGFALASEQGQACAWSRARMGAWEVAQSPILKTNITISRLKRKGYKPLVY